MSGLYARLSRGILRSHSVWTCAAWVGVAFLAAPALADAGLRLFFSTIGLSDPANVQSAAVDPTPELGQILVVESDGQPHALYVWAQMTGSTSGQVWRQVSLQVRFDSLGGSILNWECWNYAYNGTTRWAVLSPGTFNATMVQNVSMFAIPPATPGIADTAAARMLDAQYIDTPGVRCVLLGRLTVNGAGVVHLGTGGSPYLRVGAAGPEPVYLGWRDENDGVTTVTTNRFSCLYDAYAGGGFAPPSANDDAFFARDGEARVISRAQLLANDVGALCVIQVTQPAHGALVDLPSGDYSYLSTPGYEGLDSFQYTATNGLDAIANVHLTVLPPILRGDANCDGAVDFFDIDPFLLALFDAPAYRAAHCGGTLETVNVDCAGGVDFFDIDPFLDCLFLGCDPCAG